MLSLVLFTTEGNRDFCYFCLEKMGEKNKKTLPLIATILSGIVTQRGDSDLLERDSCVRQRELCRENLHVGNLETLECKSHLL